MVMAIAACEQSRKSETPTQGASANALAATPPGSPTAAPPSTPPPAPAARKEPDHPPTCEVEIAGQVKLPKALPEKSRVVVLVADNDCLAPDAHIIGRSLPAPRSGRFSIEVFSRWGSDLTICAAVEGKAGKPVSVYGKWNKSIHAEKAGEIVVSDVTIALERGEPRTLAPVSAEAESAEDRSPR
jgi:hypothetical protein